MLANHIKIYYTLLLVVALFICCSLTGCVTQQHSRKLLHDAPLLVYDQPVASSDLKNYRNTSAGYAKYKAINVANARKHKNQSKHKRNYAQAQQPTTNFSIVGLDTLHASASSQFSKQGLVKILEQANLSIESMAKVIIVDLRQESHGFINAGIPISWHGFRNQNNVNKSAAQINSEEQQLLAELKTKDIVQLHTFSKGIVGEIIPKKSYNVAIEQIYSEAELVSSYGAGYKRFFILDHHHPTDTEVDAFVEFTKKLPSNTWLHFHCRGGVGRATTFMTMYDMIRNGNQVAMRDIIQRQQKLFDDAKKQHKLFSDAQQQQRDNIHESKERHSLSGQNVPQKQDLLQQQQNLSVPRQDDQLVMTGEDLQAQNEPPKQTVIYDKVWRILPAIKRKEFINKFYEYVVDVNGYQKQSWSKWLNSK